jgi:hypothetical protein
VSNKVKEPTIARLPSFSFNEILDELWAIEEDTAECRLALGQKRQRRRDLLVRVALTLESGRNQFLPVMRDVSKKLDL